MFFERWKRGQAIFPPSMPGAWRHARLWSWPVGAVLMLAMPLLAASAVPVALVEAVAGGLARGPARVLGHRSCDRGADMSSPDAQPAGRRAACRAARRHAQPAAASGPRSADARGRPRRLVVGLVQGRCRRSGGPTAADRSAPMKPAASGQHDCCLGLAHAPSLVAPSDTFALAAAGRRGGIRAAAGRTAPVRCDPRRSRRDRAVLLPPRRPEARAAPRSRAFVRHSRGEENHACFHSYRHRRRSGCRRLHADRDPAQTAAEAQTAPQQMPAVTVVAPQGGPEIPPVRRRSSATARRTRS